MQPESNTLPSTLFKFIFIELSAEQIGEENVRECKVNLLIKGS